MRGVLCLGLVGVVSASAMAQLPLRGALFACGGGRLSPEVRAAFAERAGGAAARLVVIPTASASAEKPEEAESFLEPWRAFGFRSLELLHAHTREEADAATFAAPLASATAVWLSGGVQSRLIATYGGTRTANELRWLLQRGGVIGGTSAGCAAMTTPMIAGGSTEPEIEEGFGWLPGAIFDQHFLARERDPRLARALELLPGHVGFGVDESTALWIQGNRLRVLGASCVVARLAPGNGRPAARVELGAGTEHDWIAWVRAARARADALRLPAPRSLFVVQDPATRAPALHAFAAAAAARNGKLLVYAGPIGNEWRADEVLRDAAQPECERREDGDPLGTDLSGVAGIWIERPPRVLDLLGDPAASSALAEALRAGIPVGLCAVPLEQIADEVPASSYGSALRNPAEGDLRGLGWIEIPSVRPTADAWFRSDAQLWVRGDPEIPRDGVPARLGRPGARAHAHNDYARERPLMGAFAAGAGSLEADVFAIDDELRIGHTRLEALVGPRLRELYLEPLATLARASSSGIHGDGAPLHLLVDFKADGERCLELLARETETHRDWLTRFAPGRIDAGAVTLVISGAVPRERITAQAERWWAIDGRPADLDGMEPAALIPWISAPWSSLFEARSGAEWTPAQADALSAFVAKAHAGGRRVRFWATPADPALWGVQLDAGVDWIHVDDPHAFVAASQARSNGNRAR